jgi:phosphoglycerol transferase MdoB-like AlkP superfamily enzyme
MLTTIRLEKSTKVALTKNIHNYKDTITFVVFITIKSLMFNLNMSGLISFSMFFSSLGFALLLSGICLIMKSAVRKIMLFCFNFLITLVMLSDLMYFRYYGDVLSIPVLLQIRQTSTLQESMLSLLNFSDILFFVDLVICLALHLLTGKSKLKPINYSRTNFKQGFYTILLGTIIIGSGFGQLQVEMGKGLFTNILDQTFFVNKIGVLNFHLFDVFRHAKNQTSRGSLSGQDKAVLEKWFREKENYTPQGKYFGIAKNKNLIVVQLEAFQNFVIGQTINGQEITPNLNALIKNSLYFPNFYYQTAQGNTSDAEFLTNVSLYPVQEGAVYFRSATNTFYSLPKALKDNGYQTLAFHAYKPSYWNRSTMYQALGFDEFISRDDFQEGELIGWGLSDHDFLKQTAQTLSTKKEPFYAFLITLSSHYPYNAFADETNLDVSPYGDSLLGNYLKAVHYTDQAIGSFVNDLKQNGLWDKSVVVFYGDHNAFGKSEKEMLTSFLNKPQDDLTWLTLQQVPLIIHLPQDKLAGTYPSIGGQIDVYPTLANLLGIKAQFVMGQDLLNAINTFVIFRDGSFLTAKTTYLAQTQQFYDLTSKKIVKGKFYDTLVNKYHQDLWISDQILHHNLFDNTAKRLAH